VTYVFKPDSVDALAPKKNASTAARFPYGYRINKDKSAQKKIQASRKPTR
jgi:hypothetical protein